MSEQEAGRLAEEAGFVFKGKILRSEPGDAHQRPGVVTAEVQEVLHGTDVLHGLVGTSVTILTDHPENLSSQEDTILYTNAVSLGDDLVAREVGHQDASDESLRAAREGVRTAAERPLAERISLADLIVVGRVTSTKQLPGDASSRSEHDPEWATARVSVEAVIKGRTSRKTVEVLYASSRDIAWYRSPKLQEGTSGIFILHLRREPGAPEQVPSNAYTATDPCDFVPRERLEDVRRIVGHDDGER